jgi:hypothetical protein
MIGKGRPLATSVYARPCNSATAPVVVVAIDVSVDDVVVCGSVTVAAVDGVAVVFVVIACCPEPHATIKSKEEVRKRRGIPGNLLPVTVYAS